MADKSSKNVLGFLAFIAVIIAAAAGILNAINQLLNTSIPTGILNLISDGFLMFVVLFTGWTFASKCTKLWKRIYIALVIIAVVAFVFGIVF